MVATTVRDSIAGGQGGGMDNAGTLTIESSTVTLSRATTGGGIANVGKLDVMTGTLTGNTASADGGCLHILAGSTTVRDSTFWWCTATGAGGGIYVSDGGATIENNLVIGNTVSCTAGWGRRRLRCRRY